MPRTAGKHRGFQWPTIVPGNWQGELIGGGSVNFGQEVQPGPPRQSVEFSYIILPVTLIVPDRKFRWPGVLMIMAPTPMKTDFPDAGSLFKVDNMPSLSLSLEVTRPQFSDILRLLEVGRFKDFHFTVEGECDNSWPVRSWGMATRLARAE